MEEIVCEYKGRIFTKAVLNGLPIIHYFENGEEFGLVNNDQEVTIRALKADIDTRDKCQSD